MATTTAGPFRINNVRLSFPSLLEPKAFEAGQVPKYQATFLIDPASKEGAAQINDLKKRIQALLVEHYGSSERVPKGIKLCLKDNAKEEKAYEGYDGMWFIATGDRNKPTLAGRDPRMALSEDQKEELFYPGALVNASISLWVQDNAYGKRVNANLRGVQFVDHGERLGGSEPVKAENEFDVLESLEGSFEDDDNTPF